MAPKVSIIMGSRSDWDTMEHASSTLDALGIEHEVRVISAHRTPDLLFEFAAQAEARGLSAIIAGAGGAAHLPGMCAAKTNVPVLGVPVESHALHGLDSLLSIVQMPGGVPVATFAIGKPGATNAAIFAAQILAIHDTRVRQSVRSQRTKQTNDVLAHPNPKSAAAPPARSRMPLPAPPGGRSRMPAPPPARVGAAPKSKRGGA